MGRRPRGARAGAAEDREPAAAAGAPGRRDQAQLERFPRGLAPVASRLAEPAPPPPEPPRVLGAGLRTARDAWRGRGAGGSEAPTQVRTGGGARLPKGLASSRPGHGGPGPQARPARPPAPRAGLGRLAPRPQGTRRGLTFAPEALAAASGRGPAEGGMTRVRTREPGRGVPPDRSRETASCEVSDRCSSRHTPPVAAGSLRTDPLSFVWPISVSAAQLLPSRPWRRVRTSAGKGSREPRAAGGGHRDPGGAGVITGAVISAEVYVTEVFSRSHSIFR